MLTKHSPELVKRMQGDTCYRCGKKGHWSWYCSVSSSNKKNLSSGGGSPNHDPSTKPSQEIAKRMQGDTCFKCGQKGHWSWYCNVTSPTEKPISCLQKHDPPLNPKSIFCRCGHGLCVVKPSNNIFPRMYYACPIEKGKRCTEFVQWCDDIINENLMRPPPYKYPECECGAGVCRKQKDANADKYYFACPLLEHDHKPCGYKVWEDELQLLGNKSNIVPIQQSSQKLRDLGEECNLLVEHSKGMRVMDNSETPLSTAISELPKRDDAGSKATPSRICCSQILFQVHSFSGGCSMGWLGRLLFLYPMRSLKLPAPQPFFCCIFPSFNRIIVPKQTSIRNDRKCNMLAVSNNLNEPLQLSSSGCNAEVSTYVVSVSLNVKSQEGSRRKTIMSKIERRREIVLFAQQQLLIDLESLDLHDHESMRVAAYDTFALFDDLSIDYDEQFSKHVWDFINYASAIAKIDESMENSPTLDERNRRIEEERVRYAQIHEECVKIEALLEASNEHRQRLCEEVSRLEITLCEKQNQLKSCELEGLKIETHLGDLKRRMMEVDTTLKGRAEEAKLVERLSEERQTKQMAAKATLEKAKLKLEN